MTETRTIYRDGRYVVIEHDPGQRGVDRAKRLAQAKIDWQRVFYAAAPPDRLTRQRERAIMRMEAKR